MHYQILNRYLQEKNNLKLAHGTPAGEYLQRRGRQTLSHTREYYQRERKKTKEKKIMKRRKNSEHKAA